MPTLNRTRRAPDPASLAATNGKPHGLPRAPVVAPPGRRRRPKLAAVGVAVVVLGGLLGAYLYSAAGDRVPVIAVASAVAFGEQVEASDLVEVGVGQDPGLQPIPYADVDQVIGMTAATDLVPGSLLTMGALTQGPIPGPGEELVPIPLEVSRLPATGLRPRDEVLLVATDGGQVPAAQPGEDEPTSAAAQPLSGLVLRVGAATPAGVLVIDVLVDSGDGADLARLAADGRIALVVIPRGG